MGTTGSKLPGHGAYDDISSVRPGSGPPTPTSRVDTIAGLNALSVTRSEVGLDEFSASIRESRTWDGSLNSNFLDLWKEFGADGGKSFNPKELLEALQALQEWSSRCNAEVVEGQKKAVQDIDAVEEAASRALHGIANAVMAMKMEASKADAVLQLQSKVNEVESRVEAVLETHQAIMDCLQDYLPVSELAHGSSSNRPDSPSRDEDADVPSKQAEGVVR